MSTGNKIIYLCICLSQNYYPEIHSIQRSNKTADTRTLNRLQICFRPLSRDYNTRISAPNSIQIVNNSEYLLYKRHLVVNPPFV